MKKVAKIISGIIGIILICFLILLSYLWIKEYRPEKIEDVKVYGKGEKDPEINRLGVMAFREKQNKAQEEIKRSNAEMLKAVRALKKKYSLQSPQKVV